MDPSLIHYHHFSPQVYFHLTRGETHSSAILADSGLVGSSKVGLVAIGRCELTRIRLQITIQKLRVGNAEKIYKMGPLRDCHVGTKYQAFMAAPDRATRLYFHYSLFFCNVFFSSSFIFPFATCKVLLCATLSYHHIWMSGRQKMKK